MMILKLNTSRYTFGKSKQLYENKKALSSLKVERAKDSLGLLSGLCLKQKLRHTLFYKALSNCIFITNESDKINTIL